MKYFIDMEFHERFITTGFFKKRKHHIIELISIGIVAEDGREYYAVCKEFDLKAAMANTWLLNHVLTPISTELYQKQSTYIKMHRLNVSMKRLFNDYGKTRQQIADDIVHMMFQDLKPQFYGYYADYDWVLFCSLFGSMMQLPPTFPMYCRDLQQMKDEYSDVMTLHPNYPQQENEHNALADARWNKALYHFLINFKTTWNYE